MCLKEYSMLIHYVFYSFQFLLQLRKSELARQKTSRFLDGGPTLGNSFSGHFVSTNFDPKWTPNPPFPVLSAAFAKLSPCDSMILAKRIIQRAKLLAVFEKSPPCPGFVDLLFETLRSPALTLSEKTSWKFGSIRNCCPKSPGPQQTLDHPVPCLDQRTPSKHEVLNLVLSSPNDEFVRIKT